VKLSLLQSGSVVKTLETPAVQQVGVVEPSWFVKLVTSLCLLRVEVLESQMTALVLTPI